MGGWGLSEPMLIVFVGILSGFPKLFQSGLQKYNLNIVTTL
jgi:hypothetical protein